MAVFWKFPRIRDPDIHPGMVGFYHKDAHKRDPNLKKQPYWQVQEVSTLDRQRPSSEARLGTRTLRGSLRVTLARPAEHAASGEPWSGDYRGGLLFGLFQRGLKVTLGIV